MPFIKHGEIRVEVDEDGFLVDFNEWNEKVACAIAEQEGGPELTKERLDIIHFIREYYKKFDSFPILHAVCRNIHQPRNCMKEKFVDPMKAWKIAGLPKPSAIASKSTDEEHKIYHFLVPD